MPRFSLCFAVVLSLLLAACASTSPSSPDVITVEGHVSRRGNEPFSVLMLETPDRHLYILTFDEGEPPGLSVQYRYRITGRVYLDTWNSYPYAHLRVLEVERIP